MEIDNETAKALAFYIDAMRYSEKKQMLVSDVLACACRGPRPMCPCAVRDKLIEAFVAKVEAGNG